MIGLGDIVIPGVYVAFMLRFDLYLLNKAKKDINKNGFNLKDLKYFIATFSFYNLGILMTLCSMYFFNHAQPALLYLVPCCLLSSTFTALASKEFTLLWNFNEEELNKKDDDSSSDDEDDKKPKKKEENGENEKDKKKVE